MLTGVVLMYDSVTKLREAFLALEEKDTGRKSQ